MHRGAVWCQTKDEELQLLDRRGLGTNRRLGATSRVQMHHSAASAVVACWIVAFRQPGR